MKRQLPIAIPLVVIGVAAAAMVVQDRTQVGLSNWASDQLREYRAQWLAGDDNAGACLLGDRGPPILVRSAEAESRLERCRGLRVVGGVMFLAERPPVRDEVLEEMACAILAKHESWKVAALLASPEPTDMKLCIATPEWRERTADNGNQYGTVQDGCE